jgi:hypothetical protein
MGAVYSFFAVTLLSVVVLFVLLTLSLSGLYWLKDTATRVDPGPAALFASNGTPIDNGRRTRYQLNWFDYAATSELGEAYVAEVLDDFWELAGLGFAYQSWVGFSEPLFEGKRLSVVSDPMGLPMRAGVNPPVDSSLPTVHVYTFGGSTTFGYAVSDAHTWPSHLSAILNERAQAAGLGIRVEVSNYGRGYFDTSQETPRDVHWFTDEVTEAFWDAQHASFTVAMTHLDGAALDRLPFKRLAASVRRRLGVDNRQVQEKPPPPPDAEYADHLTHRFRMNRRIAATVLESQGTATLFFIQPDANYNYPTELFRREVPERWWEERRLRELFHERMRSEEGVIRLTSLFDEYGVAPDRKAIVDDVHYSPAFSRFLAERVAAEIDLVSLASSRDPLPPTGVSRAAAIAPERAAR